MRVDILGVGFDNVTMDQAVAEGLRLMSLVPIGRPAYTPREKPLRPDAVEFRANEEA